MTEPRIGSVYSRSVFFIDWLLCLTAFFSFVSIEVPIGAIGLVRLPAELCLGVLCLLFLFVLWGQRRLRTDLGLVRPKGVWACELRWWIGAYLLWMWIGVFFSPCPMVAFKAAFTYTATVLPAFYAAYKMETETPDGRFGRRAVGAALLGLGLFSLVAIVRYHFGDPVPVNTIFRITQPFLTDHTHWGALLVLWLFPCLYFVRYAARPWQRVGAGLLVVVFLMALWISHCRAAAVCLVVPLGIAAVLVWRRWPLRRQVVSVVAVALVLTVVGVWGARWDDGGVSGRSAHWGENLLSIVHYRRDASAMERVNRWKCAARITADRPVFGCGKDVYPFVYGPYQRPEDLTEISTYDGDWGNAHSEYASAFSETGIPGGLLFLGLVFCGFLVGIKAYRTTGRCRDGVVADGADVRRQRAWILSLLLGLAAYFTQGFFNNFLYLDSGRFSVFLMWALLQAAYVRGLSVRGHDDGVSDSSKTALAVDTSCG